MKPKGIRVVFVTTVFEGVDTGPGIYAQYLWRAFRDDPDIEFNVVAPEFVESHPHLHSAGLGSGSLDLYRRVQEKAAQVAVGPDRTILHGNSTHGMGRLIRYCDPLIVQVNDYETAAFPSTVSRLCREAGLRKVASTAWRSLQESRVLRRATLALCNSEYTASIVRSRYGLDVERLRVIHKAVDTSALRRPIRLPPNPAPDRAGGVRLVFVGSDWRRKGLDVLIQAVCELRTTHARLTLVVMGPESDDADLLKLIQSAGLMGTVRMVGKISRDLLASYLWHSDLFVLPSRREALGVAVLEGMAAGLPIVATKVGGIPEMVQHGVEGLLVEPGRANELVAAIGQLLDDPAGREAMARAGVNRAQRFSVDTMIGNLRILYREVASGHVP